MLYPAPDLLLISSNQRLTGGTEGTREGELQQVTATGSRGAAVSEGSEQRPAPPARPSVVRQGVEKATFGDHHLSTLFPLSKQGPQDRGWGGEQVDWIPVLEHSSSPGVGVMLRRERYLWGQNCVSTLSITHTRPP